MARVAAPAKNKTKGHLTTQKKTHKKNGSAAPAPKKNARSKKPSTKTFSPKEAETQVDQYTDSEENKSGVESEYNEEVEEGSDNEVEQTEEIEKGSTKAQKNTQSKRKSVKAKKSGRKPNRQPNVVEKKEDHPMVVFARESFSKIELGTNPIVAFQEMLLIFIELETQFYRPTLTSNKAIGITAAESRKLSAMLSNAMAVHGEIYELSTESEKEIFETFGTISPQYVTAKMHTMRGNRTTKIKRLCKSTFWDQLPESVDDVNADSISDLITEVAETEHYHQMFAEFVVSKVIAWYTEDALSSEGTSLSNNNPQVEIEIDLSSPNLFSLPPSGGNTATARLASPSQSGAPRLAYPSLPPSGGNTATARLAPPSQSGAPRLAYPSQSAPSRLASPSQSGGNAPSSPSQPSAPRLVPPSQSGGNAPSRLASPSQSGGNAPASPSQSGGNTATARLASPSQSAPSRLVPPSQSGGTPSSPSQSGAPRLTSPSQSAPSSPSQPGGNAPARLVPPSQSGGTPSSPSQSGANAPVSESTAPALKPLPKSTVPRSSLAIKSSIAPAASARLAPPSDIIAAPARLASPSQSGGNAPSSPSQPSADPISSAPRPAVSKPRKYFQSGTVSSPSQTDDNGKEQLAPSQNGGSAQLDPVFFSSTLDHAHSSSGWDQEIPPSPLNFSDEEDRVITAVPPHEPEEAAADLENVPPGANDPGTEEQPLFQPVTSTNDEVPPEVEPIQPHQVGTDVPPDGHSSDHQLFGWLLGDGKQKKRRRKILSDEDELRTVENVNGMLIVSQELPPPVTIVGEPVNLRRSQRRKKK